MIVKGNPKNNGLVETIACGIAAGVLSGVVYSLIHVLHF